MNCHSIKKSNHSKAIKAILTASLDAVEPGQCVNRWMGLDEKTLTIGDRKYDMSVFNKIVVLGAGKAAGPMAFALLNILEDQIANGLIIVKKNDLKTTPGILHAGPITLIEAAHPVPDEEGFKASTQILKIARELTSSDLLIAVIAGGASSLLTCPASGISLEDVQTTTELLLKSGADIKQLNTIRKHISSIKGGQLVQAAFPAQTIGLILSDVVGDPIDAIGSGPTAADPTTFADALKIIDQYELKSKLPRCVTTHLKKGVAGKIHDTPQPDSSVFETVYNQIIGSNKQAAGAAKKTAEALGFCAKIVTSTLTGEARDIGKMAARRASELAQNTSGPTCLIFGGETTVTIRGSGKGGRNQELALAAAIELDGIQNCAVLTLATDGQDGPTDAAGAIATGQTIARAKKAGLDPRAHLDNNDAYQFFKTLDDLLIIGPTQTNVADLLFVFSF